MWHGYPQLSEKARSVQSNEQIEIKKKDLDVLFSKTLLEQCKSDKLRLGGVEIDIRNCLNHVPAVKEVPSKISPISD